MQVVQSNETSSSPSLQGLSDFESYSRTELPRLIEANLQAMVDAEVAPLEENIKALVVDVVRRCQSTVAQNYGRIKSSTDITATQTGEKSTPAIEQADLQNANAHEAGFIQPSYDEPPFRDQPVFFPEPAAIADWAAADASHEQEPFLSHEQEPFLSLQSDSGYGTLLDAYECQCGDSQGPNGSSDEVCALCGLKRPFNWSVDGLV